ncbi:uncharacterized protein LOC135925639 isoform X2 [Gordionus sp. m RMFG-2023]|uniref:uncharacterized protein LOC135925639 isoform X2 n=1 Tax=Gordionus sp. m RMFG-2023 TaxID=3053472 RepID=UPI0031FD9F7A
MLPSKGYFKTLNCPFFQNGLCEKPYCHFRHSRTDLLPIITTNAGNSLQASMARNILDISNKPEFNNTDLQDANVNTPFTIPHEPDFINYMAETIKNVKSDTHVGDPDFLNGHKFTENDCDLSDENDSNYMKNIYDSHTLYQPSFKYNKNAPVYNPTPISQLKNIKHVNIPENSMENKLKIFTKEVFKSDKLINFTMDFLSKLTKEELDHFKKQYINKDKNDHEIQDINQKINGTEVDKSLYTIFSNDIEMSSLPIPSQTISDQINNIKTPIKNKNSNFLSSSFFTNLINSSEMKRFKSEKQETQHNIIDESSKKCVKNSLQEGIDKHILNEDNIEQDDLISPMSPDQCDPDSGVQFNRKIYGSNNQSSKTKNTNKIKEIIPITKDCKRLYQLDEKTKRIIRAASIKCQTNIHLTNSSEANGSKNLKKESTNIKYSKNEGISSSLVKLNENASVVGEMNVDKGIKKECINKKQSLPFKSIDIDIFSTSTPNSTSLSRSKTNSSNKKNCLSTSAPKKDLIAHHKNVGTTFNKMHNISYSLNKEKETPKISEDEIVSEHESDSMVSVSDMDDNLFGSDDETDNITSSSCSQPPNNTHLDFNKVITGSIEKLSPRKYNKDDMRDKLEQIKKNIELAKQGTIKQDMYQNETKELLLKIEGKSSSLLNQKSSKNNIVENNLSKTNSPLYDSTKNKKRLAHKVTNNPEQSNSKSMSTKLPLGKNNTNLSLKLNPSYVMLQRTASVKQNVNLKNDANIIQTSDNMDDEQNIETITKKRMSHILPQYENDVKKIPTLDNLNILDQPKYIDNSTCDFAASKISLTVRQRYLNMFYREILTKYKENASSHEMDEPNEDNENVKRAFETESAVYSKGLTSRSAYFNTAASTIKHLRSVLSNKTHNHKNINPKNNPKRPAIHSPILTDKMKSFESMFASALCQYMASPKQLAENGYPVLIFNDDKTSKNVIRPIVRVTPVERPSVNIFANQSKERRNTCNVHLNSDSRQSIVRKGPKISIHKDPVSTEQKNSEGDSKIMHTFTCCRCAKGYSVYEIPGVDGGKSSFIYVKPNEECLYHWGRLRKTGSGGGKKNAAPILTRFSCCGEPGLDPGCTLASRHVNDKPLGIYRSFCANNQIYSNSSKRLKSDDLDRNSRQSTWVSTSLGPAVPLSLEIGAKSDESEKRNNIKSDTFKNTREEKEQSKVYGLDCEMIYTPLGTEVARITLVGYEKPLENFKFFAHQKNHDSQETVIYDTYVKPRNEPVIDYNTRFSGIRSEHLNPSINIDRLVTFDQARIDLCQFLANPAESLEKNSPAKSYVVLVGHSLESDLVALELVHNNIVDTALVFPHRLGLPFKRALRTLSTEILKKIIQEDDDGHDSKEDAMTCLELMKWKVNRDNPKAFA